MKEHECIIGLLHHSDYSELITLNKLKAHIKHTKEFNDYIRNDPPLQRADWLLNKEWTIADYTDRRKSTDLYQFEFCPVCGKPIDWKAIRRLEDDKI